MKVNDTLLRHWHMLREIPRHPRKIGTPELQQRLAAAGFETTIRTIQRDLIKLSAALPLITDDAKPQGWSWEAHAVQFDLPSLDPQAALVFHFAERHLQALLPASTLGYLSPWFRTATGVLDNQGNGLSGWRKKVRVLPSGQPLHAPNIDSEIQATVTQALLQNRRLALSYHPRTANYEERHYDANPLGLVVRDQVIYLICTLRDYDDIRQLVLSRIGSAEILDTPVRIPKGFDLDHYIAAGELGWIESGNSLNLVVHADRIAASTFIERPIDPAQVIEDLDEHAVRLTATVRNTKELRRWLLNFGAHAEIIAPKSLRDEMKAIIQGMSQRYSIE